jgi:hypothetical protein
MLSNLYSENYLSYIGIMYVYVLKVFQDPGGSLS